MTFFSLSIPAASRPIAATASPVPPIGSGRIRVYSQLSPFGPDLFSLLCHLLIRNGGHPSKGKSRQKTPHHKKNSIFFLIPNCIPARLCLILKFAPAISRCSTLGQRMLIRTSHPSGSRQCALGKMLKARPSVCLTDPGKPSVPCRVQWDVLQILWFLANPFVTHGIGEAE